MLGEIRASCRERQRKLLAGMGIAPVLRDDYMNTIHWYQMSDGTYNTVYVHRSSPMVLKVPKAPWGAGAALCLETRREGGNRVQVNDVVKGWGELERDTRNLTRGVREEVRSDRERAEIMVKRAIECGFVPLADSGALLSPMDDPKRAVRVFNELNPHLEASLTTEAEVVVCGYNASCIRPFVRKIQPGGAWKTPYVAGTWSTDEETCEGLVKVYGIDGRVVVDAPTDGNFITTREGEVVCVDVGAALDLPGSEASRNFWHEMRRVMPAYWNACNGHPRSVLMIKALLVIQTCRPDVTVVSKLLEQSDRDLGDMASETNGKQQSLDKTLTLFPPGVAYFNKMPCFAHLSKLDEDKRQEMMRLYLTRCLLSSALTATQEVGKQIASELWLEAYHRSRKQLLARAWLILNPSASVVLDGTFKDEGNFYITVKMEREQVQLFGLDDCLSGFYKSIQSQCRAMRLGGKTIDFKAIEIMNAACGKYHGTRLQCQSRSPELNETAVVDTLLSYVYKQYPLVLARYDETRGAALEFLQRINLGDSSGDGRILLNKLLYSRGELTAQTLQDISVQLTKMLDYKTQPKGLDVYTIARIICGCARPTLKRRLSDNGSIFVRYLTVLDLCRLSAASLDVKLWESVSAASSSFSIFCVKELESAKDPVKEQSIMDPSL